MATNASTDLGERTRAAQSNVRAAQRIVARERTILRDERDAFRAFARRIDHIDGGSDGVPSEGTAAPSSVGITAGSVPSSPAESGDTTSASLARIRRAYEKTVMAVPHYSEEYDESYRESLASEFNPGIAAALVDASHLRPIAFEALRDAVTQTISNRSQTLNALERERTALTDASTAIHAVAEEIAAIESRPFFECDRDELDRLDDDLDALTDRCDDIVAERQSGEFSSAVSLFGASNNSFDGYLYTDLDSRYPVFRDVTALSDRINTARRHIWTAKASREVRN